ncbi:MAG TPA: hypothetical protein VMB81_02510 [Candidatus Sulfotelmatobacter sp.]|nr:hypothetical protein [Candidatus Sulfotelmatobacter sp.]
MISLTRREFEAASSALTQVWTEARWAALARRARRRQALSELERPASRGTARSTSPHPAGSPPGVH